MMTTTTPPSSELATELIYRLLEVVVNYTIDGDGNDDNNIFSNITATAVPTPSPFTRSSGVNPQNSTDSGSSSSRGTYEFIAFVLWYLFLVTCCIVPTCCAYRRRRLLDQATRRFTTGGTNAMTTPAEHQQQLEQLAAAISLEQLQLLQQQAHQFPHGLYLLPTLQQRQQELFRTAQELMDSDIARTERTRRLQESLKETTFVVQEEDVTVVEQQQRDDDVDDDGSGVVEKANENDIQPSNEQDDDEHYQNINHRRTHAAVTTTTTSIHRSLQDMEEAVLADLEVTSVLQLPKNNQQGGKQQQEYVNADRTVPGVCAICLCGYEVGDKVTWSKQSECQHAFHQECIVPWLAKNNEGHPKCPCCRQVYCNIQPVSLADVLHSARINATTTTDNTTIDGSPMTRISSTTTATTTALTPLELMLAIQSGGGSSMYNPHEFQSTIGTGIATTALYGRGTPFTLLGHYNPSDLSSNVTTLTTTNETTNPNSRGDGGADIEEGSTITHNVVDGNGNVAESDNTVADTNTNRTPSA